ncbi:hypothetical protein ACFL46_01390 [Candidatus Neomarinimicrobiota bacterium]
MSLKTVFTLNAIVAGFFAVICLLIPTTMLSWYGPHSTEAVVMMTRYFGVGLLALALLTYFLKDAALNKDVKSVILAILISDIVGVIVSLWAVYTKVVNNMGWLTVIIYGFFSIALYLLYRKK